MKIRLLIMGKTTSGYIEEGMSDYLGRLVHYAQVEVEYISPGKQQKNLPNTQIKQLQGEQILDKIRQGEYVILLDEKGKEYNSVEFSGKLEKLMMAYKSIVFVIGGAFGFDDAVYVRANEKLSLSKMTFSHQIVRLFFAEQLYRAFTILKNEPYHHE